MSSRLAGSSLLALLLLAPAAGADGLYRWVDEEGKVHFGDRPPRQAQAEDLSGKLRPVNDAQAVPTGESRSERRVTLATLEDDYDRNRRQQQQREQQQRLRACARLQRQLRIMQGAVAIVDESGDEVRMTERERQQRAAALEREVSRRCG
ncbi:DUF4124 domain-containing protein [Microbulbifer yueqingensis]|uniref:DUF4124 domain-containing protein n=1 Tax=Microbulbifer yueqingensis TaxID=658219 RepID=A0A1G9DD28_9GAMM|nr:DUF4124 domain-containing protein [Microbulbifer yueqingensis]SDK61707.1 protein of unknown function [Microbulbifer yueqingensis]